MRQKRYLRHILWFCLLQVFLFAFSNFTLANELMEQEPLIFLVNQELVPIAYLEDGIAKGVVVDIAKALGEKIQRPIEVRAMDWLEAQNQLLLGHADALLQVNRNLARDRIYDFSSPLLLSEFVIFRRHADLNIRGLSDLSGKRLGIESSGHALQFIDGYNDIEVITVKSSFEGFDLLQAGDVDALILDRWLGEYALAASGITGIQALMEPLEIGYSHIAVIKGNDEVLNLINYGLQKLSNEGTLNQILDDWRGKNIIYLTEEARFKIIVITVTLILASISGISIFFIYKLRKLNEELEMKVKVRTQELAVVNERLEEVNEELRKLSLLDQLTQIPNRRGFDTFLAKAWRISRRTRKPLALIIIDVDKFKHINDTYGHLTGDLYLRDLANLLKEVAQRPGDQVARLAGDEFACVLLDTTEDGAFNVAEHMRKRIEKLSIVHEGAELRFSASFGVAAMIPDHETEFTKLFAIADQALYKAKEIGRNKVFRASEL